jgi:sialate O-acetylesterase
LGDFPFYYVQLPSNNVPNRDYNGQMWAAIREAQLKTLALPNTGMAVTIDLGEPGNMHPKNKQDIGHRLALIANAKLYNKSEPFSGPLFKSAQIQGAVVRVDFTGVNGKLLAKGGGELQGFEICGDDQQFHPATARIEGQTLTVASTDVPNPVAIRYAWTNNPESANLTDDSGLPASPFRSDSYPIHTRVKK